MRTIWKHLSSTSSITNTIDSDSKDELDELPKELLQYPNNSDLIRILNCDLAINKLTTFDTSQEIWLSLNLCYIKKFGNEDHIYDNILILDLTWACIILPTYRSWNTIKEYCDKIDIWINKVKAFCKSNFIKLCELLKC